MFELADVDRAARASWAASPRLGLRGRTAGCGFVLRGALRPWECPPASLSNCSAKAVAEGCCASAKKGLEPQCRSISKSLTPGSLRIHLRGVCPYSQRIAFAFELNPAPDEAYRGKRRVKDLP